MTDSELVRAAASPLLLAQAIEAFVLEHWLDPEYRRENLAFFAWGAAQLRRRVN